MKQHLVQKSVLVNANFCFVSFKRWSDSTIFISQPRFFQTTIICTRCVEVSNAKASWQANFFFGVKDLLSYQISNVTQDAALKSTDNIHHRTEANSPFKIFYFFYELGMKKLFDYCRILFEFYCSYKSQNILQ